MICSANQWTGFYMITASVMKELSTNPTKWSNTLKQFVGLFKCVWPFCGGMVLKGLISLEINPFHAHGLLIYPLKTSENQRFSNVFQGIE